LREVGSGSASNALSNSIVISQAQTTSPNLIERLRITSDAYVRLAAGTGGIQFGGNTAAANALDDYEEGNWTPIISGQTTAGTGTYTYQIGRYTKIGNRVIAEAAIEWSAHTGTGVMQLGPLPFATANVSNFRITSSIWQNSIGAAPFPIQTFVNPNTTAILFQHITTTTVNTLNVDTAGIFVVSISYPIA
jgi:hypothetical protein